MSAAIIGLAFAIDGAAPVYLPLGHRYLGTPPQLDTTKVLEALGPALAARAPNKHVHDAKDAEILLARRGVQLGGIVSDPMISSYLLDPAQEHDLPSLCERRLGAKIDGREALCGSGKKATPFESVEVARAAAFAGCEAEATLRLGARLKAEVDARGMGKLNDEIELPLSHVLAVIERHGVLLDVGLLRTLSRDVEEAARDRGRGAPADRLGREPRLAQAAAGAAVRQAAAPRHQEDQDRFLRRRRGAGGAGAAASGGGADPRAPHAVQAQGHLSRRAAAPGRSANGAAAHLVQADHRRHRTALVGRSNLQNVPIRTEQGKEIRRAFKADAGNLLVVADYSQIELRVLAHLSKDPVLTDAFRRDQDIHRRTVAEMFGADHADDPKLRSVAKMINYGIVYGLSDFGLAQRLGIERADAKRYIEGYLETYAVLNQYMERLIAEAHRDGGARTLLGRFRPIPELASRNRTVRMQGERMARNTPIQGTAADLLKIAMIRVQKVIDEEAPGCMRHTVPLTTGCSKRPKTKQNRSASGCASRWSRCSSWTCR